MVELNERLDFVHYRELTALRDIANLTRLAGVVGGARMVMRIDGEFKAGKVRPTREYDIPVDQSSKELNASLDYSLGFRHELSFEYERYSVRIQDTPLEYRGIPLESLLDRDEYTYNLKLSQYLSTETTLYFEGFYSIKDYVDKQVGRDADGYGVAFGFDFSPTGNLRGTGRLGIERIVPDVSVRPEFKGLVGAVDVKIGLGQRFALEGLYYREPQPSIFIEELFYIENRIGVFLDFYIGRRFFVRPGLTLGRNNFPDADTPSQADSAPEILIRRYMDYSLSFNYQVAPSLLVSIGSRYSERELFSSSSLEERFIFDMGLRTQF
jgi:hypothetical protein